MKKMIDSFSELVSKAFEQAGYDASYGRVNLSSRPDLCEYQCSGAMACAKAAHKKPIDIAGEVAERLQDCGAFETAEVCMPGFINLRVSPAFLRDYLRQMAADGEEDDAAETDAEGSRACGAEAALHAAGTDDKAENGASQTDGIGGAKYYKLPRLPRLGLSEAQKPERIIVDYGGANAAKPLHVGHLRSAVIGEAVKRMGARMGHHMIGDVHLGDWGLQMGLIIEELKDRGQTEFGLSDLEEIYPAASKKAKETDVDGNPTPQGRAFKERALSATSALQSGDPEARKVWKRIMELSLADLKRNYDALDVHFELWKGESDVQSYIPEMIRDMEARGIAYRSQGALVVDVAESGDSRELPPCIIQKSDGSSLYATTDLATIIEREKLYAPDAYIYIADQRQSLHFTSFFRVAKKAGIVRADEKLTFLGFGTMNGRDGKPFKTRQGGLMHLSDLIEDITKRVYEKIRETRSEAEIPEDEAQRIAKTVGLAALKYGDLSNQASKDYIFDLDRFVSFEGNTGPYILYTIVRIESILSKYFGTEGRKALDAAVTAAKRSGALLISESSGGTEKTLALLLARYNEAMESAYAELAPHKLCQYIYEVSDAFNSFYHETKILSEADEAKKRGYLALLSLCREVLLASIEVLGFSAPERM